MRKILELLFGKGPKVKFSDLGWEQHTGLFSKTLTEPESYDRVVITVHKPLKNDDVHMDSIESNPKNQILDKKKHKVGGKTTTEIVYTYDMEVGTMFHTMKNRAVKMKFHGHILKVVYSAPVEKYDKFSKDFETFLKTIELI